MAKPSGLRIGILISLVLVSILSKQKSGSIRIILLGLQGNSMSRKFQPGDDLLFQLESGFGLLRVLAIENDVEGAPIWHLLAYQDLFPDGEMAENALDAPDKLSVSIPHMALTNRAFERTPTAKLRNRSVSETELEFYVNWKNDPERKVSDRSALLMLGLR